MLPMTTILLPGTPHQQLLLHTLRTHYASDPRVRAVLLFGSLARGTWDAFSDLDLVIVLADDHRMHLEDEIRTLCTVCAHVGDTVACIDRDGLAAVDLLLASLIGISLQYHALQTVPFAIMEHRIVLAGALPPDVIHPAESATQPRQAGDHGNGLDHFLRLAVEVDIALQRSQFWRAFQCLQLLRDLALSAYAITHGGVRPFYFFQAHASPDLQALLGATIPHATLSSAQDAFHAMLDLVEQHLALLTNGLLTLSAVQLHIIVRIRARQADLRQRAPHDLPSA